MPGAMFAVLDQTEMGSIRWCAAGEHARQCRRRWDDVGVAEAYVLRTQVAGQSSELWADIRQGRARATTVCCDHREAPRGQMS